MRVAGVILAGGEGRRMGGRDKAFLALAGRPLVAHAVERLAPQAARLAISANGDPARFAEFGLPVLPDPGGERAGPLSGIEAGLAWAASEGMEAIVTAAVDTPFLPPDLVARLLAAAGGGGAALAESGGVLHPVFGLWPVAALPAVRAARAEGRRKLRDLARELGAGVAAFPVAEGDPFLNVNTPDDLSAAEARLAGGAA